MFSCFPVLTACCPCNVSSSKRGNLAHRNSAAKYSDRGGSSGYTGGTTARESEGGLEAAPSRHQQGTEDGRAQAGPEVQGRGPTRAPSHNGPPKNKTGRGRGRRGRQGREAQAQGSRPAIES